MANVSEASGRGMYARCRAYLRAEEARDDADGTGAKYQRGEADMCRRCRAGLRAEEARDDADGALI